MKYKVGQPVMLMNGFSVEAFGVITRIRSSNYPYIVKFSDDLPEEAFTEHGIKLLIEDYNEYARQINKF